jgi:hypothetical protein
MSLLKAIGGAIGLAIGGPMGAALGSGIGSLASGGDIKDAITSGIMGFGIGSIPGAQGLAQSAMGAAGLQGAAGGGGPLAGLFGGAGAAGTGAGAASGMAGAGAAGAARAAASGAGAGAGMGGLGTFLGSLAQSPLVMASLMEATQPKGPIMTPLQQQQMATGERPPTIAAPQRLTSATAATTHVLPWAASLKVPALGPAIRSRRRSTRTAVLFRKRCSRTASSS